MSVEIERKFLVLSNAFEKEANKLFETLQREMQQYSK